MREIIENAILRSLMNFERGWLNFGLANHTVKMTGERLRRRGLGSTKRIECYLSAKRVS